MTLRAERLGFSGSELDAMSYAQNDYRWVMRSRASGLPNVEPFHGELSAWAEQHDGRQVDVLVSTNVLEHIEDDRGVMRLVSSVVRPGGAVLRFVPALPSIYGTLDATVGHLRRYSKDGLDELLTEAGLAVRKIRYMNMAGAIAWYTTGRVLRRRSLSPLLVHNADSVVIPVGRLLDPLLEPRLAGA